MGRITWHACLGIKMIDKKSRSCGIEELSQRFDESKNFEIGLLHAILRQKKNAWIDSLAQHHFELKKHLNL